MRILIALAFSLCLGLPATAAALSKLKSWRGGATPLLKLKDLQGKTQDIADYRGKVVLVNFWATWCAPCIKEMPSLARIADKLAGEQFALLTVNFGENAKRVQGFIDKLGIALPVLLDSDMIASKTWVDKGLPTTYLIGADGRIRYQILGELEWDSPEVEARIRDLLPSRRAKGTTTARNGFGEQT